jgi:DNA modification methylase
MDINLIKLNDHNPRDITPEQFEKLKKSIQDFPQMLETRPLVIDENNVVIGGNMRLRVLQDLGFTEVPVKQVTDWTEEQKKEFVIKDNLSYGVWDWEALANEWDVRQLEEWGMDVDWKKTQQKGLVDEDFVPTAPPETDTKVGDLFLLGEHRLMCGDATNPEHIQKLMEKTKADCVFTDPPYNVNYSGIGKKTSRTIKNDNMGDVAFGSFLTDSFSQIKEHIKLGAGCYIFHSHKTSYDFEQALRSVGFHIDTTLIWNKPAAGLGMNDYRTKHEPFFYACLSKKEKRFYGDRTGTTVWKIPEDDEKAFKWFKSLLTKEEKGKTTVWTMKRESVQSYEHPTQKPVELAETAIVKSTKSGDIVLDTFLGSGTTLIASEKTSRICYGMELDGCFVDVIVKRWEAYTGLKAIKL